MKKSFVFLAGALVISGSALAGGGAAGGGATEYTQLRNEVELILQYEQTVMGYVRQGLQLQNEIDNLIKNPFSLLGKDVGGIINKVGKIMSGANSIAGGVAQIDRNFATKFKSPSAASYSSKLTSWNSTSTATLDKVLASVDLHREDYASDTARIEAVVRASESTKGAAGALDTLRDINLLQIEHTRKLGELLATQNEATATYMAQQVAKDQAVVDVNKNMTMPATNVKNTGTPNKY
jgi:P-type conjugative transfer protein TrbJ